MRPITARASLPASQRARRTPTVRDLFQGPPPEVERCFTTSGTIKHFEVLPEGCTLLLTDSALVCLEPDGNQRWRYTPEKDWTPTAVHRGENGTFHLYCDVAGRDFAGYKQVDPEGKERLSLLARPSKKIRSVRSRQDGLTCVVTGNTLQAFDPSGKLLWKRHCPPRSTLYDFLPDGQPVLCSEGKGFLGRGFRFHTRALDPETGKTVGTPVTFKTWPRQIGPVLAASLGDKDARVEAADLLTGDRWQARVGKDSWIQTGPDGNFYVETREERGRYLTCLKPDGSVPWGHYKISEHPHVYVPLAMAPDGTVLYGDGEKVGRIFPDGRLGDPIPVDGWVSRIKLSPDGNVLYIQEPNDSFNRFDLRSGEQEESEPVDLLHEGPRSPTFADSPNGLLVTDWKSVYRVFGEPAPPDPPEPGADIENGLDWIRVDDIVLEARSVD